ncbi:MAG: polyhydroxyalkanoate synthesis regulator DNA-binding domain-containing protein [Pseudomonadota bacterium]
MRLIRKQKNRRLYDTVDRRNITLQELARLIGAGEQIQVEDGTNGENITRTILLQILLEQESPGRVLLSEAFLESLIRLGHNPLQQMASNYLDASLAAFERYQSEIAERWRADAKAMSHPAEVLTEAAQRSLSSWISMQRSIFDAWSGRGPKPPPDAAPDSDEQND